MTTVPPISAIFCFLLVLLVPLAIVGVALVNSGLSRSRSAAHAVLTTMCVFGVSAIVYVLIGCAWQGAAGEPFHAFLIRGRSWNWMANTGFFLRGVRLDDAPSGLLVLFQIFTVGLAAVIPLGGGAERWKLGSACVSSALLAGWTYPVFAHWVWSGGWLSQLGTNYGLGRGFVDGGGSGVIHAVGGLTALAMAWILGPRHGKFTLEGVPAATPGHNSVLVLTGCLIAWVGWLALNTAGAVLITGVEIERGALIALNTTLSAAAAGLTAVGITRYRFGKPDASLTANGWIGGLVASSAAAAFLKPMASILVGVVAAAFVLASIDLLESRLRVDDPGGSVSVHAVGGIWGLFAVCFTAAGGSGQWLAQLIGVATLIGFALPMSYALNWALNKIHPQRVDEEGERRGMDLTDLGGGAYPEFVVHSDEFTQY